MPPGGEWINLVDTEAGECVQTPSETLCISRQRRNVPVSNCVADSWLGRVRKEGRQKISIFHVQDKFISSSDNVDTLALSHAAYKPSMGPQKPCLLGAKRHLTSQWRRTEIREPGLSGDPTRCPFPSGLSVRVSFPISWILKYSFPIRKSSKEGRRGEGKPRWPSGSPQVDWPLNRAFLTVAVNLSLLRAFTLENLLL